MEKKWPLAPTPNTVAVMGHGEALYTISGQTASGFTADKGSRDLLKSRKYLASLEDINFDDIATLDCDTKEALVSMACDVVLRDTTATDGTREQINHASLLGIGDTLALMSMIAREQAIRSPDDFNEIDYKLAVEKSLPTILFMSRLSSDSDAELVMNMMNWSKAEMSQLSIEELMRGLEYDSSFFDFADDGSAKLKDLSDIDSKTNITSDKSFDLIHNKNKILLGCPFRSKITHLYKTLLTAMIQNGIARDIYLAAKLGDHAQIECQLGRRAMTEIIETGY